MTALAAAIAAVAGFAAGAAVERHRPCGTRWSQRELVKYVIATGRTS